MTNLRISRRTVLRGLGTAIALPWLEAMGPLYSLAANTTAKPPSPKRMAFFYVPNGVNMEEWKPKKEGAGFTLPKILEPLQPVRDDVSVLSGLACDKAWAHGDGPGDHARAMSAFLTGAQPRKTHGADIRAGISVDQVAALRVGKETRFGSLELGCDKGLQSGNCDSGYSCAYSANLSWRSEATPMAKEVDPRLLFERLFAGPDKQENNAAREKRNRYDKSVLDFVTEDASRLKNRMGATDQRKLEEYLSAVREIELRIIRNGREPAKGPPGVKPPTGIPQEYQDHVRQLLDLLALAFQGDLTRVATFVFANEGSNRSYKSIGVADGHHDLSHHGWSKEKLAKICTINRFHMEQWAYFLQKLRSVREGDGTLLDQCLFVYGSGNGDGNRHNHDDLPILLVGKGGGTIKSGRHLVYPKNTPLCNLFVGMLDRVGVPVEKFGDSTGKLEGLS